MDAVVLAAACGADVAVESSRTAFTQVLARPDGRLAFESAVVPQRARQSDGSWADIDLTLVERGGVWRPRISIADVAFSAGGVAPVVSVVRGGKRFTMSWPGGVPAPVVSGDTATYAEVLPGVDLVLRATRSGFTHVLVVKSVAAAAHAAVRSVRFDVGGDARLQRLPDGSVRAVAGQTVIASGAAAVMWDSSAPVGDGRLRATKVEPSSARGAGDAARVRKVDVQVTDTILVLRPDAALLGSASAFPVFIDPSWSAGDETSGQKWAYANNANATNEFSVARVGKSPDSGHVYRSFFEFPTLSGGVSLKGKYIYSARVQMTLVHSHACTDQWNYLYQSAPINATPKASWSAMTLYGPRIASQAGHANKAGGCGTIQPDMVMNYSSGGVRSLVQTAADNNWNALTVGFAALDPNGGGESTIDRWMKFDPEQAKLVVDYDSKPGAPANLKVADVNCPTSGVLTVGTLTPTLSAKHPDADPQTLTGTYEWIQVPAAGMGSVTDTSPARLSPPPAQTVTANAQAKTPPLPTLSKTATYAFRARSTDPAPYSLTSPWSAWCQFKVDNTKPAVTVDIVTVPPGPGKAGTFTIKSTATDVTKFKWGWGAATNEVAATGTSPKTATITVTAPKYGLNVLHVSAIDGTLNEGFGSKEFTVNRPSPAVARWGLETYPGVTQTSALADQQPTLAGNTPLTPTNLQWEQNARLIGGHVASFNGTSTYLATSGPVLDTTKSFSVAAWAKLDDLNSYHTVVSQVGTSNSRFTIRYSSASKAWNFYMFSEDTSSTAGSGITGPLAVAGQWTHLAGAYDATHKTMSFYVNGVLVGTTTHGPVWNATGPVNVGRKLYNGITSERWVGQIAGVQLFDRVLVPHDFTGMLATDPESGGFNEPGILTPVKTGAWDFEAAVPCYTENFVDSCETPDLTGFDRWLAFTRGAAIGAGRTANGSGLWLDNAYFPEDQYNESTTEWARSAHKTGTNGDLTTWQDTPVLRTDQSFTISAWARVSRTDTYQTVLSQDDTTNSGFILYYAPENGGAWKFKIKGHAGATDDAATSWAIDWSAPNADQAWTHIVVVVDAGARQVSIFVNGVLKDSRAANAQWVPWQANGPLTLGRSRQGGIGSYFYGGIDDVQVFQGAMTEAAVANFYDSQAG